MANKKPEATDGWPIKEVWEKYEEITMHFNDLLIKLRTQALAGVAAISTLVSLFAKTAENVEVAWEISAFVFFGLCLFWIAVWILDFRYYNRLLVGAVVALVALEKLSEEKSHVRHINMSTTVERAVRGDLPLGSRGITKLNFGRWAYYTIVFITLLGGLVFSICQRPINRANLPQTQVQQATPPVAPQH